MALFSLWGTWEELILGGAVLLHGTADWNAIATELQNRTDFPDLFTPQVCEAKYEDLQERYSGCDAWFEELRSQRVAELKKELEKSVDSIGTLQSKLESLTAEKESDCNNLDYFTSRSQSISPADVANGADYFCKEASIDGLSAGSFTRNTERDWAPEIEIAASCSLQDDDYRIEMASNLCADFGSGNFRRKRDPRKRKPCNSFKEASVGESETRREDSSEGCMPSSEKFCAVQQEEPVVDLAGIVDSISKHKDVSILRYKIEKQKNSKYKKLIRRHVDLETISSGISNGSISSAKELFRDLLLLCNNALVFHKRNSPKHKSAHSLRNIVMKNLRHTFHSPISKPCEVDNKLQNGMAYKTFIGRQALVAGKGAESPARKRGGGRPPKGSRRGGGGSPVESSSSTKGRKKVCR
ncbi:uncharacterized protein LOC110106481 isoform X1 [Dendrobium catenatum]|uniref:uncharacterized protein LOC110106481 isoform X1 n=1 Tax=Dendrobium catenatum TaxID=906689 RepID=UPI0009F61F6B|nr:uncharacterized protein LOC110106481 isoform X1 [Dendrobium catenatum]